MPSKMNNPFEFKAKNLMANNPKNVKGFSRYIIPDHIFNFYSEWAYHLTNLITPLITQDGCGFYFPINLYIKTSLWETEYVTYGTSYRPNIILLYLTDIISASSIQYDNDGEYDYLIVDHSNTLSNMIFLICHEITHIMLKHSYSYRGFAGVDNEEAKVNSYVIAFLQKYNQYFESIITDSYPFYTGGYLDNGFNITNLPATGGLREGKLLDNIIYDMDRGNIYSERNDRFVRGMHTTAEAWYSTFFNFTFGSDLYRMIQYHPNVRMNVVVTIPEEANTLNYAYVTIKKDGKYLTEGIPTLVQTWNQLFKDDGIHFDNTVNIEYPEADGVSYMLITEILRLKVRDSIEYKEEEDGI